MGKIVGYTELEKFNIWGKEATVIRVKVGGKIPYIYHFQLMEYRRDPVNYYVKAKNIDEAKKLLKNLRDKY